MKKKFPNAYAFFQQFTIRLSDQEQMINQNKTPDAAAAAWMSAHPDKVNQGCRWRARRARGDDGTSAPAVIAGPGIVEASVAGRRQAG